MISHSKKEEREYEAAKNSAAGSLSLRPHSRKELEVKLKDKGYSPDAIDRALDRLKELVILTCSAYTSQFTMQVIPKSVTPVVFACCRHQSAPALAINCPQQSSLPFTAGVTKRCRLC